MRVVFRNLKPMRTHALSIYLLLALAWAHPPWTQQGQRPLLSDQKQVTSHLHNNNTFIRSKVFAFDVDWQHNSDHLTINENVSSTLFPGGIKGAIKFTKGDLDQQRSCLVLVHLSSSIEKALTLVSISNDTNAIYVNSADSTPLPSPSKMKNDLFVDLNIIIFIKPNVLQFGHTNVETANLDIDIAQDLRFETYHMSLNAEHGSITGYETTSFTAHEMRIKTTDGAITGNWSLPSLISFTATNGPIDINLIPKLWSSGPYTTGDLYALSETGDIAIRMPLDSHLSLRNSTTSIEARKGSITGTFVHSAVTSLVAYASITATLLPYWAFYDWAGIKHNYITTDSHHGNTTLDILPPKIDSYYKINPLFFAVSKHMQGSWVPPLSRVLRMNVTYPGQWGGVATGYSGFGGRVFVSGEDFEEIGNNDSTVKVERRPLGSEIWFETDTGTANLRLEGCDRPGCGYPKQLYKYQRRFD